MLTDPQAVTYATVSKSLVRSGNTDSQAEYRLNDSGVLYKLVVGHQFKARNRCVMRLSRDSYVTDVLIPANSQLASMTATMTFDFPTTGLTATDAQNLGNALTAWATSANILKVINGEI